MAVYGKQFTSEPEIRIIRKKQGGGGVAKSNNPKREKARRVGEREPLQGEWRNTRG